MIKGFCDKITNLAFRENNQSRLTHKEGTMTFRDTTYIKRKLMGTIINALAGPQGKFSNFHHIRNNIIELQLSRKIM